MQVRNLRWYRITKRDDAVLPLWDSKASEEKALRYFCEPPKKSKQNPKTNPLVTSDNINEGIKTDDALRSGDMVIVRLVEDVCPVCGESSLCHGCVVPTETDTEPGEGDEDGASMAIDEDLSTVVPLSEARRSQRRRKPTLKRKEASEADEAGNIAEKEPKLVHYLAQVSRITVPGPGHNPLELSIRTEETGFGWKITPIEEGTACVRPRAHITLQNTYELMPNYARLCGMGE